MHGMLRMTLLWWQHLPLLIILIQLLCPNRLGNIFYAEALLNFKSMLGSPWQHRCSIFTYPCQWQRPCLKDPGAFSLGTAAKMDGNNDVPTLTPLPESQVKKPQQKSVAAIVGGAVAALVVIVILVIVYFCLMRVKRFMRQTSETPSSTPSPVELQRRNTTQYAQNTRPLTILELQQATRNFSQSNIIGEGRFGLVYKGLLQDGTIVAIKRRLYALTHNFILQVNQTAQINHIHLVKLIGYYEDENQQLLVYEYLPNGNVGNHLYDNEGSPIGRLDLRRRLSIALGAAKGLEHLHSLVPPLVHTHFRTKNVLVDESFTAKVSDYGFYNLQSSAEEVGTSSNIDHFLDPELNLSQNFWEKSDVYSFGIFLLELISGREVHNRNQSSSEENLVFQAKNSNNLESLVDGTLGDHQKRAAAIRMIELALLCLDESSRRPSTRQIVQVLEWIQDTEIGPLHSQITEEIGLVTLGSELFK